MSDNGVPLEAIADLVGHRTPPSRPGSTGTNSGPVINQGAEAMDAIFDQATTAGHPQPADTATIDQDADRGARCATRANWHPAVEQTVRDRHSAGRSQRAIARELGIDRRKIKRIIDHPT